MQAGHKRLSDCRANQHDRHKTWRQVLPLMALTLVSVLFRHADAQITTAPFNPQGRQISPFGYGKVRQQLIGSSGTAGSSWCANLWGPSWQCISVSGGNSCSLPVPAGEVVSCNPAGTPPVDESAFQPIDCKGQATGPIGPLGSGDWCLIAGLEPSRTQDTVYWFNDWLRIGLNRRFGGTVFELYGTDKLNRIAQNGGGALQLSLWGGDAIYAPPGSVLANFAVPAGTTSCSTTGYSSDSLCETANSGRECQLGVVGPNFSDCVTQFACGDNGASAGAPINPIQAISAGCSYGVTQASNDEARISSLTSSRTNFITSVKYGPQQFTKSTNQQTAAVTWSQTMHLVGPFALLSYDVQYNGATNFNADFQEVPAVFTHQGFAVGPVYYYSGTTPYTDSWSPVTKATPLTMTAPPVFDTSTQIYQLPARSGPFGTGIPSGYGALLTEDWVSLCDASESKCITVFSTSPDSQDIVYNPGDSAYFGIHDFFALAPGLHKTISVWIAPYRFDDIVEGKSVRAWAYQLRSSGAAAMPFLSGADIPDSGIVRIKERRR